MLQLLSSEDVEQVTEGKLYSDWIPAPVDRGECIWEPLAERTPVVPSWIGASLCDGLSLPVFSCTARACPHPQSKG